MRQLSKHDNLIPARFKLDKLPINELLCDSHKYLKELALQDCSPSHLKLGHWFKQIKQN